MQRFSRFVFASFVLGSVACGPSVAQRPTTPRAEVPPLDGSTAYDAAVRTYQALPLAAAERVELRQRILGYLGARTPEIVATGAYDPLVEHLAGATSLFLPGELERPDSLPASLAPAARALADRGAARGDEGVTLGALCVLRLIEPGDASVGQEYDRVVRWGSESRSSAQDPFEARSELVDVWSTQAEICPTSSVLDGVAERIEARRDAAFAGGPRRGADLAMVRQLVSLSALEVAGVYLQHQDLAGALQRVGRLGTGQLEQRLRTVLERANGEGRRSADSLAELSEVYAEGRPPVAAGICTLARRSHPEDPRFPICLARLAAQRERSADATAYYAEAIDRAPEVRATYDEAIQELARFIAGGLFAADPDEARALVAHAEEILAKRTQRWPEADPAVPMEQFHLLVGMLAMNAGDVDQAARRFEASVSARPTAAALLQWGTLLERRGQPREAARRYREALDLTPQDDTDGALARAELLEHIGDAFRASGDVMQSNRMYAQALGVYRDVREAASGEQLASIELHRGGMLAALGRHDEARQAYVAALEAAPFARDTYAGVLTRLTVAPPDPELASEVFRRAQSQVSLEPEWKVYFALWVRLVRARAGAPADPDAEAVFRAQRNGTAWHARLARFALGDMTYDELLASADGVGERCEAHFYEGARLLGAGDPDGARARFEQAVDTRMVMFFEYALAQTLWSELGATARSDTATPAASITP